MANMTQFKRNRLALWIGVQLALFGSAASAQTGETEQSSDGDVVEFEDYQTQDRVEDPMGVMPTEPVDSVFGFDKTVMETPRGVSSFNDDFLDNFEIESLNDLSLVSPSAFRQSFFGVSGSLDIRGNPGENYFRGIKRLNNPGNFPTPIGASKRIDIVRGPATPIMGQSKVGGYLNFVPKTARVETGQYLDEPAGGIEFTRGRWDKNVLSGEVGGPGEIMGQDFGYHLYGEVENSDSFYRNSDTNQTILQASFNTALSNRTRIEFGGMRHDFDGNQVAGWNRLTQDLIDDGTYITGRAPDIPDMDGDGRISRDEWENATGLRGNPFLFAPFFGNGPEDITSDDIKDIFALGNPGTTELDKDQVLVAPEDRLQTDVNTLYFDLIHNVSPNFSITNKTFFEGLESISENTYGFSQRIDSSVTENKTIFAYDVRPTNWLDTSHQLSPSIRHIEFERGQDFSFEFFDRRDLTEPSTPNDKRTFSTDQKNFDDFLVGRYTDYGIAYLGDFTIADRVGLTLGGRFDAIDFDVDRDFSRIDPGNRTPADSPGKGTDNTSEFSYNISLNYQSRWGVTPYFTIAEQSTVISDQGNDVNPDLISEGNAMSTSELTEFGVKADLLNGRLYMAAAFFSQERTDAAAQDLTSNVTTETEGYELEARWMVTDRFTVTGAATKLDIFNLNAEENGGQFSFAGVEDLVNVDGSEQFGANPGGIIPVDDRGDSRKAGTPEYVYSLTGNYRLGYGLGVNASAQHVDSVASGFSKSVRLPAYTLVNLGASYRTGPWKIDAQVKNLTNKDYFRSNFPDLFGSTIVKPERPRHWTISMAYDF